MVFVSDHNVNVLKSMNYGWLRTYMAMDFRLKIIPQLINVSYHIWPIRMGQNFDRLKQ